MTVRLPRSFQNAARRPASAMRTAMAGTHGLMRQLSTKYQKPKRRMNGIVIALATHSLPYAGGICDGLQKSAAITISAYTASRKNHIRTAPPSATQALRRLFWMLASSGDVAAAPPVVAGVGVTGAGALVVGAGLAGAGVGADGVGRTIGDGEIGVMTATLPDDWTVAVTTEMQTG